MPNESNESYNLMLDPSMLLDSEASERILPELPILREEGAQVFIPRAFINFLAAVAHGDITPDGIEWFVGFYVGAEAERRPLDGMYEWVQGLEEQELVRRYNTTGDPVALFHGLIRHYLNEDLWLEYERGHEHVDYYHLPHTLFDEWVFLQEYSWLLGNNRNPFDQMVHAGGVALQWGKRYLDVVVRKTRHKGAQETLTRVDRLTTLGKWVAIAGIAAVDAGLLASSPPAGLLFTMNLAPSVFMLIDP